ncbi:MAG: hypothetical protein II306_10225, partial [Clostridia bacterium]|nr:hypothetical protein [Clostridia bacterium]
MAVKSFDEYYKKQAEAEQKIASDRVAKYTNENNKITDEYISSVGQAYDISRKQAQQETDYEI